MHRCRAGEIRRCAQLRELSLEANRLSAPVIDLRALGHLRSLQLFGNPLEFLPELTPCSSLRHLSLANVRPARHLKEHPPCMGRPASGALCQFALHRHASSAPLMKALPDQTYCLSML